MARTARPGSTPSTMAAATAMAALETLTRPGSWSLMSRRRPSASTRSEPSSQASGRGRANGQDVHAQWTPPRSERASNQRMRLPQFGQAEASARQR